MRHTDMSPGSTAVTVLGHKYDLIFSLAAIDEICDRLDCKVTDIVGIIQNSAAGDFRKKIITMLTVLINCAVDLHNEDHPNEQPWTEVSEESLRKRMTNVSFAYAFEALVDAYVCGFISKAGEKDEDDISADPNPERAT